MSSEITLDDRKTTFLPAQGRPRIGRAVLTSDRILLFDERWNSQVGYGVGGPLAAAITERLQRRHEAGGPFLDLPLSELAGVFRRRKGLNRDVLLVRTRSGDEHRFIGMFSAWSPLLQDALTGRHGRAVTPEPGGWSVG
jgi:hypothetical protein